MPREAAPVPQLPIRLPVNGNPCPKCGVRAHLMAGANVVPADKSYRYLVCWSCNICRKVMRGTQWMRIRDAKASVAL